MHGASGMLAAGTEFDMFSHTRNLAFTLAMALAACGGHPGDTVVPGTSTTSSAPASTARASATLRIVIPRATSTAANSRRRAYVSPATQSIGIAFTPSGGGAVQLFNQNLTTASNPNCTASLVSPLVCSVSLSLAAGSYTATFTTYDGLLNDNNVPTGNVLSSNQALPVTIVLGSQNALNVTLQGVPTSIAVLPVGGSLVQTTASALTIDRCFTSQQVLLVGFDADGNAIVGSGAPTPALTSANAQVAVSTPSVANPNRFTLTSSSVPAGGSSLTLTASVTPPASSGMAGITVPYTLTFTPSSLCGQSLYVANYSENNVVVFPAHPGANVSSAPTAVIGGGSTGIVNPYGVAVDTSGRIYIASSAAIIVFAANPSGNVTTAPIASLPNSAGMDYVAVGPDGSIYGFSGYALNVYAPLAQGAASAPLVQTISGANTLLNGYGGVAVDTNGNLFVGTYNALLEFAPGANGNVAPIASVATGTPAALTFDSAGVLYAADQSSTLVSTYSDAPFTGTITASLGIAGSGITGASGPIQGVAVDSAGYIYINSQPSAAGQIAVYAAGAQAGAAPIAVYGGTSTLITSPTRLAIH